MFNSNTQPAAPEPLRFRVRGGLQIHRSIVTTRVEGKRTMREARHEQFGDAFGRQNIELPPDEVPRFAHALEPTDAASAAALEALHFKPPVREVERSHDELLAERVIAATVAALVSAGLLKAPFATKKAFIPAAQFPAGAPS